MSSSEKAALGPYVAAVDLDAALICEGHVPWYLLSSFAAIVRGNVIYFRAGVYRPGTREGLALLGHELTHVAQYRRGMTALTYLLAALRGYEKSRYEREAFAVQARIVAEYRAH